MINFKALLTSTLMSTFITSAVFAADKFSVGQDMHNLNRVSFSSSTSLASFVGTTASAEGDAIVDLKDLSKSTGEIKIDLTTLDTGIKKRNEHMNGLLQTDKNRYAIFKLKKFKTTIKALPKYKKVLVKTYGDLTINGITKPHDALVEFTYMPEEDKTYRQGEWVHLSTEFNIKLSNFGIKAPGVIPLKVNDDVKIAVDIMGQKK